MPPHGALARVVLAYAVLFPFMASASAQAGLRPESTAQTGNPMWAIGLSSLTATTERPIFSRSRRPPAPIVVPVAAPLPPPPAPPPAPPEPFRLILLGTVLTDGPGLAIFFNPATGATVHIRIGDGVDGWTLRAVNRREASFERGVERTLVALPAPGDPPSAARPPAAATLPHAPVSARSQLPPERPVDPATAPPWAQLLKR